MTEPVGVGWPTCDNEGCIGIQIADSRYCLAHAGEAGRDAALHLISDTGAVDMRGVPISKALLSQVRSAAPSNAAGQTVFKNAQFDHATFWEARFEEVIFEGIAIFEGATFKETADFTKATFDGAGFENATFEKDAMFLEAAFRYNAMFTATRFSAQTFFANTAFGGETWFAGAVFCGPSVFGGTFRADVLFDDATFEDFTRFDETAFEGEALFSSAKFRASAWFAGATFRGPAQFTQVTFEGPAGFDGTTFRRSANFSETTFEGLTHFDGTTFRGPVTFANARFEQARRLGPLLACRGLVLDDAQFAQPIQVEASALGICCRRARFSGGVQFQLRWAIVMLDGTDFPAPSLIVGTPHFPHTADDKVADREKRISRAWHRLLQGQISERPQLLSLQRANVAGLGLSNVSVADCRFAYAHNLDKLRLEANISFAVAPPLLGRLSWDWRQVIAEERDWRAKRSSRWDPPWWPGWKDAGHRPEVLGAGLIAGLYRALRRGREDTKEEPGAADFYYGEMEMRRHARHVPSGTTANRVSSASRGRAERGVLIAYWLVSGYGLRAWRALACLAVVIFVFAAAFHLVGFARPPEPISYWTSLLYAFRATLSLTDPAVKLTALGQLLQALLRLTGPVLLGLALLALRARVKR